MEETPERLYKEVLSKRGVRLDEAQQALFLHACKLSLRDNPIWNDSKVAANVYLNFVLRFPQLELPPLELNKK